MVGQLDYSSVPTSVELENHNKQKKYTINGKPHGFLISIPLCVLMTIGALLLAILVGLLVFFLVPRCSGASPSALTKASVNKGGLFSSDIDLESDNIDDGDSSHSQDPRQEVDERLPNSIEPTHYRLQIIPFFNNLTTSGDLIISFVVKKQTDSIIVNAKDINIDKDSLKVRSTKSDSIALSIKDQKYIEEIEQYHIIMRNYLETNTAYTLQLMFTGSLNSQLQGFYLSEYESQGENKKIASTQFSPTDARKAFPCFDEPAFKAQFSISIGRPSNLTSLSNMKIKKTELYLDNYLWDHYDITPKMSTYLLAFFVGDFRPYAASDNLIQIKLWSRQEYIYETAYASEVATKVLHFFENYFDIKYKLPKIDIIAIPDFGYSAMENWGLITFRESALLYNPQQSDIDNKRDITMILAHELAHQWFGNLVTPKWWSDLWLKEGFATYLEYLGGNYVDPSWKIQDEFIMSETCRAFAIDSLESARPISFPVKNSKQIRQTFDELSYAKGASIIRMMNHFLGDEAFKIGLKAFLRKYQFKNANSEELFHVFTEEAQRLGALDKSISVGEIMQTWTKQAGFPVITAVFDEENRKLILTQKRFFFTNTTSDATWWIPISLTTSKEANFIKTAPTVWLKNERSLSIDFNKTNWYLLNIFQTGYYIVNYDEANWKKLIDNIMEIPAGVRAQLIGDAMDLAKANLLDYHIPLKMIARMAFTDDDIMFVPTWMAFEKLQFLSDILYTTPAFGMFEKFQSTIFEETYKIVNTNTDYYSDNYLFQRIRRIVLKWACRGSHSECTRNALRMFREWMQGSREVAPNLRSIVYCTAIREGNELEWDFAYQKYLDSESVSEKNMLLDALGCTTKKWLLSSYLNMLLQNGSIRIQDADRVFKAVADNVVTTNLAFDFLRTNWNELLNHYGEGFNIISKMVKSLPKYMNTEYQLYELIRFEKQVRSNLGTAKQAFQSAIESAKVNVEWMKKNYASVQRWFEENNQHFNA